MKFRISHVRKYERCDRADLPLSGPVKELQKSPYIRYRYDNET